ncbi:MAG: DUF4252 domain-containing protein [Pseudomonadales bacterium]|nr:DUF4252 domain-containing protein [Pseudomonadales bacterium]
MKRVLLVLIMGSMLAGCMSFSDRSMRPVRNSIIQQMPEIRLKKEMAVALGGGMFDFLDIITLNEADLSEVDHLQVAVYQVYPQGDDANFTDEIFQESLLAKDASLTWERIIRVREDGEHVWVFVGMNLDEQALEAVSVFVVESNELVLINMDGDLNELLEYAFEPARGHPGAYKSG